MSQSNQSTYNTISDNNLEEFKKLVRKAVFLESSEDEYFKLIPNTTWIKIFDTNFGGNLSYAQRVILNKNDEINLKDTVRVDREKLKIHNLDKATNLSLKFINQKKPILFITDFDNDGSLSQAIINEYLDIDKDASKNMQVHYAQVLNGNANRGFTVDLVDRLIATNNINPNDEFLIITADNGINSKEEQKKIQEKYPEANIIITDHHNPDDDMVIEENEKTIIFNPHYKPTEFYSKFNISGATTVGVLLKNILTKRFSNDELDSYSRNLNNIQKLSKVSNLLDYVNTDPADKPEQDYIITRFLSLQPLLNINNSISKIITGEINTSTVKSIKDKIPQLNSDILYEEAKNIHIQNNLAKILLSIYSNHKLIEEEINLNIANLKKSKNNDNEEEINKDIEKQIDELNKYDDEYLNNLLITNLSNYTDQKPINPNYIEQLRPLIFGLAADDGKSTFMDALNNKMIGIYESIRISEKAMAEELRKGEVITKSKLEHSYIVYTDKNILTIFNRKFLNKVYNDENPGFSLTLDNIDKGKVSGSFRSLYDISDILKNKKQIEKALKVKIETPGHERAAGFIMKSNNPEKNPITKETIDALNVFINDSIAKIKDKNLKANNDLILTDLAAITLIDKINRVIRGNVSHFERITPILQLSKDTIWTDSYTTKQYTMEEIINDRKYGYITIDINFHGDTVIVPIELIRKIVATNYKNYLSLNYLDGGVFMVEKIISEKEANNVIDLRDKNTKSLEIIKTFEKDFNNGNFKVKLNRNQIKDNPFFKYNDYGELSFDLFEKMVIGIIDSNNVDTLAVFDVEANGFANAKLMNLGSMNYEINPKSGTLMNQEEFYNNLYSTTRGEEYLLTKEEINQLIELSEDELEHTDNELKKLLLTKESTITNEQNQSYKVIKYYNHPLIEETKKQKKNQLPFVVVKNYLYDNFQEKIIFNREVIATMLAFLVKDDDFKVPQQMTNLTGITEDILKKYGKYTDVVDAEFTEFYKDKSVLFGAHNTPYDARVLRANTPKIYNLLKSNKLYDSAIFSKQLKLAYDYSDVNFFENVNGIPKNVYFNSNKFSDFSLDSFISKNENGYYPDRTNRYLLGIENNNYLLVDKEKHDIIQVKTTKDDLLARMRTSELPNVSIKYSIEKLSEQWMIHALLLSDEKFDINLVDLQQDKYKTLLPIESDLKFLQENYHFDISWKENFELLGKFYAKILNKTLDLDESIEDFSEEFLTLNKKIHQKFNDAWMYKAVLGIKEPEKNDDITNDLVELVHFQTSIPKDKIVTIFKDALNFKRKYGIDHIIQHESHVNGPWESDVKGDIAFEDKLTLTLLAQRYYDPYNHNIDKAIDVFNAASLQARYSFEKADILSEEAAFDSYSFRQALLYNRKSKTDLIETIQNKEDFLNNDKEEVINFKLKNDILNIDNNVTAIKRANVIISREQTEKDSELLSFIAANEQLKFAIKNKVINDLKIKLEPLELNDFIADLRKNPKYALLDKSLSILESNDKISIEYKKDLSTRYRVINFNKKIEQMKDLLDFFENTLVFENSKTAKPQKTKRKPITFDDVGLAGFNIVKDIITNYIYVANKNESTKFTQESIDLLMETIDAYELGLGANKIELALINKNLEMTDFNNVLENSFLNKVNINRQNPSKLLLDKFSELRLINAYIEENNQLILDDLKDNIKSNSSSKTP